MKKACKRCRREGVKLMLKGERCYSPKCAIVKRSYPPGEHGPNQRIKLSEYGRQLREKQKLKAIYGVSESKLSRYYKDADRGEGNTTENLVVTLESRVDNTLFRAGLVESRSFARQLVSHGKVKVNGRKVTVPSIILKPGDVLTYDIPEAEEEKKIEPASWLSLDDKKQEIAVDHIPSRDEIDLIANESLVVEYYSR